MKKAIIIVIMFFILRFHASSHHGVASLGSAGINGPGAPLETSTSSTIPKGKFLFYIKYDDVIFKKFTEKIDEEKSINNYWNYGIGWGVKSYLSLYLFQPYNVKLKENSSFNTAGFSDPSFLGVFGFKYDEGFKLVPEEENLDDLKDWHFTLYSGFSIPTGKANFKNPSGEIEPDMSTGFGKPTFTIGFTATKQISEKFTMCYEVSLLRFSKYNYSDGKSYKFGEETRANASIIYRFLTDEVKKFRWDIFAEANFLNLKRDYENYEPVLGSGGKILYSLGGVRIYFQNSSLGLGVKFPVWKSLNEDHLQQGCEGKEKVRIIATFSVLF